MLRLLPRRCSFLSHCCERAASRGVLAARSTQQGHLSARGAIRRHRRALVSPAQVRHIASSSSSREERQQQLPSSSSPAQASEQSDLAVAVPPVSPPLVMTPGIAPTSVDADESIANHKQPLFSSTALPQHRVPGYRSRDAVTSAEQPPGSRANINARGPTDFTELRATRTMQQRLRLEETLHTGILSVDALAPIGKGGSMLCVTSGRTGMPGLHGDHVGENCFVKGVAEGCKGSNSVDEVYFNICPPEKDVQGAPSNTNTDKSIERVWRLLAQAEQQSQDRKKHVLCVIDMGVVVREWEAGQKRRADREMQSCAAPSSIEGGSTSSPMLRCSGSSSDPDHVRSGSSLPLAPWGDDKLDPTAPSSDRPADPEKDSDLAPPHQPPAVLSSGVGEPPDFAAQRRRAEAPPECRRGFFSEITERAANLKGGGSVSLLLTINREEHEVNIVHELQSLTDGHLWLEEDGTTLDCRRSLTRFGLGAHQGHLRRNRMLQKIAGHLRLNLLASSSGSSRGVRNSGHLLHQGPTTNGHDAKGRLSSAEAADAEQEWLMRQVHAALSGQKDLSASMSVAEQIVLLLASSTQLFPRPAQALVGGKNAAFLRYTRSVDGGRLLGVVEEKAAANEALDSETMQKLAKNAAVFCKLHAG